MLDIAFLSRVIPKEKKEAVLALRRSTMSESAEALQWKIIAGLDHHNGAPVKLFNYLPVQSFPRAYRRIFVRGGRFAHAAGACDIELPFFNLCYVKRLFMGHSLYRHIKKWAKAKSTAQKVLIAYSFMPEYMRAVALVKRIDPTARVISIADDLPQYSVLEAKPSPSTRLYLAWLKKKTIAGLSQMDGFVLLTAQMADIFVTHQPFTVMEGIATPMPQPTRGTSRRIVYAGLLHRRMGLLHLLDAFAAIKDPDIVLTLCGRGDCEEEIRAAAAADPRIDFCGQCTREEVLSLLCTAHVIVNPRNVPEEFTKYSFPSKNLEALSAGVPFVAYKLPGIPDEYDAFINYPRDNSPAALAALLQEAATDADGSFTARAAHAVAWLKANKDYLSQTQKIMDLIKTIGDKNES